MTSVSKFSQLPIYNTFITTDPNDHTPPVPPSTLHTFRSHGNLPSLQTQILITDITQLILEHPNRTICLRDSSKSKNGTAYAYSIDGTIISHRIRDVASIFTTELMTMSHLAQLPPNHKYILFADSLSSL